MRVTCAIAALLCLSAAAAQAGIRCWTELKGNTVYLHTVNNDHPWGIGKPGIWDNGRTVPEYRSVRVVVRYRVDFAHPTQDYYYRDSDVIVYTYTIRAGDGRREELYVFAGRDDMERYRGRWRIYGTVCWYEDGYDERSDDFLYYYRAGF